ncbi:MAG: helix-turn-helix transcriptional regulator, partial [Clostridia bacterium]|nr:helix-turn-helix transcriptional regulator [Clostridia bacterium]
MTKGQRIRKARESENMTQTELANRLKISKQTLYKYENDIITNIPSNIIEQI